MVKQYPYILEVLTMTGGGYDDDGAPIPATSEYVAIGKCRDEANVGGKAITINDGEHYVFNVLIQMPKNIPALTLKDKVRVMEGNMVRASGTVKGFRRDQMHARAWL